KKRIAQNSRVLFVDDGSKDRTWSLIQEFSQADDHFLGIQQSRNRGHQNAVLAGLMTAKDHSDVTISIDADGQDDL
ncbi:glycosyltransferase, partial [Salmonella enterica subsp. enterica serovar Enteritidis]|nr:glycosyltransferase [Salmonella enterica subsp. enterica serovar Enteritidis]